MTACTCDSHTTATTTPALTCTSTGTGAGNAIYASSMTTTALKVNGGAATGNAMEITPNVSNANGMYVSISSGYGKCIALNHVGSAGGAGLYVTTGYGSGVYSNSTNGFAVQATSVNSTAIAANSNAGTAITANSTSGSAIIASTAAAGATAVAVTGVDIGLTAITTAANGGTAIQGTSNSANGHGVVGISASGIAIAGYTTSSNTNAVAVSGVSSGIGSIGVSGRGLMIGTSGILDGGNPGYGIFGVADLSHSTAYAGYFQGRAKVTDNLAVGNGLYVYGDITNKSGSLYIDGWGTIAANLVVYGSVSKASGTFTIDHPSDPENKILNHSFVESPDMKNVYDGRGEIDAKGSAQVKLPSYFSDLNENFCYQLTMLGGSATAPLRIQHEINELKLNEFTVSGDPGQKFCWQVTGSRKDAYAKMHPVVVEVEKNAEEKGAYLHPEVFGQPKEKGIHHRKSVKLEDNKSEKKD